MTDPNSAERIVLKILSGIQSGAEVSLTPGEYTIGSGDNDDIQLIDVSLRSGHVRIRVAPGKIEICGGSGALATANGLAVSAGSDQWQEVEPLDIVTAGTIRFALGLPSANWTTLTGEGHASTEASRAPHLGLAGLASLATRRRAAQLIVLTVALTVLTAIGFGIWYMSVHGGTETAQKIQRNDVQAVRAALDQFPFGKSVDVRQEVDGTIYVTGYVEAPVERRALAGAIEKSGVPVRLRLGVLQSLRDEVGNLIKAEGVLVTFTLAASGDLTLEGVILNEEAAAKFLAQVKDSVVGLNQIVSRIRTGKALLADIVGLGQRSHIDPWVLFRLDGDVVEATGSLPDENRDGWSGFLQSYSRRFAKDIALRSFVHLQNVNPGDPITFDRALLERIARGEADPSEILAGYNRQGSSAPPTPKVPVSEPSTTPPNVTPASAEMRAIALQRWERVRADLNSLSRADVTEKYLKDRTRREVRCRARSLLTAENLPKAVFWLDLLSVSTEMSLATFDRDEQSYILEAALDPTFALNCLTRLGVTTEAPSLYLVEAPRNPDLIHYITRDFPTFATTISGTSLSASRYVQLRDGQKIREGSIPDRGVELSLVGELGVAVMGKDGYSVAIYPPQMNWMSRSNATYGSRGNWSIWN